MHEMHIDIEQVWLAFEAANDVVLPHFFRQGVA